MKRHRTGICQEATKHFPGIPYPRLTLHIYIAGWPIRVTITYDAGRDLPDAKHYRNLILRKAEGALKGATILIIHYDSGGYGKTELAIASLGEDIHGGTIAGETSRGVCVVDIDGKPIKADRER